jgi:hypothetical protein
MSAKSLIMGVGVAALGAIVAHYALKKLTATTTTAA